MLKWLVTEKEDFEVSGAGEYSEDPLATIAGLYNKKYEKTYSVNRWANLNIFKVNKRPYISYTSYIFPSQRMFMNKSLVLIILVEIARHA